MAITTLNLMDFITSIVFIKNPNLDYQNFNNLVTSND